MGVYKLKKRYGISILAFLLIALVSVPSWGQTLTVTGKVTDSSGEPLMGVYVLIEGTARANQQVFDGDYSINVPTDGTLIFSFMGFNTVIEPVNGRSVIHVNMDISSVALDELVVTALGIKKRP